MASSLALPSLPIVHLRVPGADESTPASTTLKEFCAGKAGVIDLWHTKCTRCPAALAKLNDSADEFDAEKVLVIACALSQGPSNMDDVSEFIDEWSGMNHIFVEEKDKDELKAVLGYSAVPFYVIFDKSGNIVASGEKVDYKAELQRLSAGAPVAIAFDEDF